MLFDADFPDWYWSCAERMSSRQRFFSQNEIKQFLDAVIRYFFDFNMNKYVLG